MKKADAIFSKIASAEYLMNHITSGRALEPFRGVNDAM